MEINAESPGGMQSIERLYEIDVCPTVIEALEYTPAFPRVTADLATSASLVGLTLTTFFLGMALGQLLGGPLSDQRGRRMPIIVGGLICTLGAVGCALAPSIGS